MYIHTQYVSQETWTQRFLACGFSVCGLTYYVQLPQ